MKKLIAVGATAAMLLAATAPALAQDATVDGDGVATGGDVSYYDASQLQVAIQIQEGDATATADDGSEAEAYNDLYIDQYQYNGGFDEDDDFDFDYDIFD